EQAGIDINPALNSLRINLERRDKRPFLRVTTSQPVNEPFLDILIELSCSSGRLVREYTFLLDPPEYRSRQQAIAAAPLPPVAEKPAPTPAAEPTPAEPAAPQPAPEATPSPARQGAPRPVHGIPQSPRRRADAGGRRGRPAGGHRPHRTETRACEAGGAGRSAAPLEGRSGEARGTRRARRARGRCGGARARA